MCLKQISGERGRWGEGAGGGGGERRKILISYPDLPNTPFHDFFQLLTMTRAQLFEGRLSLKSSFSDNQFSLLFSEHPIINL